MDDTDENKYFAKMDALQTNLLKVRNEVQGIADYIFDKTWTRQPEAYRNDLLMKRHQQLIEDAEKILDQMKANHAAFNEHPYKSST